ncbi:MAG: hypothetical protein IPG64_23390 [Haliea sp.]|nr:hypothetical protein [Haliea sp.]
MSQINACNVREACRALGTESGREVADNAELTALLVSILNSSLQASQGKLDAVLGFVDKHAAVAGYAGKSVGNDTVRVSSASAQILTQSLILIKLGSNASPGMVVATLGAMFTKKMALAFGLVDNNQQAKLLEVTSDMVSSTLKRRDGD